MAKMSRRGFVKSSGAAAVLGPLTALAKGASVHSLFVGTQTSQTSKGIYSYSFDSATGELKQTGLATEADMPTFLALAPNGKTLFVANEINQYEGKRSGAVSSYAVDRAAMKLTKINEVSAGGPGTCHVTVDHTGHCAFAANYGGGSAASFAVDKTGKLSDAVSFFQYTGHGPKEQQKGPRGHRVTVSPDNKFLFVNDLGLDEIHVYHLDTATAKLTPQDPPAWTSEPGSGPRSLIFHPNGKWAYCVNEVGSSVNVLDWDAKKGVFTTAQLISTVAEGHQGPSAPSDVVMDKAGQVCLRGEQTGRLHGVILDFTCRWKADVDGADFVRRQDAEAHCVGPQRHVVTGCQSGDRQSFGLRARCQDWQTGERGQKLSTLETAMHRICIADLEGK